MAKRTSAKPAWLVPGAAVQLISGGFPMTVLSARYQVCCVYCSKNESGGDSLIETYLPVECLRQADDEIPF